MVEVHFSEIHFILVKDDLKGSQERKIYISQGIVVLEEARYALSQTFSQTRNRS